MESLNATLETTAGGSSLGSLGDTTIHLIEFAPPAGKELLLSASQSSPHNRHNTTSTTTSTSSSKKKKRRRRNNNSEHLTELLNDAFEPERQQYLHDIEALTAARDKALENSRKVLAVTTNTNITKHHRTSDLPRRALFEHNKIKSELERAGKRVRTLETTNRTLNIELSKCKKETQRTKEKVRREMMETKAAHEKDVVRLTSARDESQERCRRLYDSMLSAEVTIKRFQERTAAGADPSEVIMLRQRCEENELMSERIKEAATALHERAESADKEIYRLKIRLANSEGSSPPPPPPKPSNKSPSSSRSNLRSVLSRSSSRSASLNAARTCVQSVKRDYNDFREDLMKDRAEMAEYINTTSQLVLSKVQEYDRGMKIKNELAAVDRRTKRSRRRKNGKKLLMTNSAAAEAKEVVVVKGTSTRVSARQETLRASPAFARGAAYVARGVGEAVAGTRSGVYRRGGGNSGGGDSGGRGGGGEKSEKAREEVGGETSRKLQKKLDAADAMMRRVTAREKQTLQEHSEKVESMSGLIRVLREQMDEMSNEKMRTNNVVKELNVQLEMFREEAGVRDADAAEDGGDNGARRQYATPKSRERNRVVLSRRSGGQNLVDTSAVRAAYQKDLLVQSEEISTIIDTVRSMMRGSSGSGGGGGGGGGSDTGGVNKQMVVWNGMLEKQNIMLEKQLVLSHGELAALRQSLTRSNAAAQNFQNKFDLANQQLKKSEKGRKNEIKKRLKLRTVLATGTGALPSVVDPGVSIMELSSVADSELRDSMMEQIELLESEKFALQREVKSLGLIIHNLTKYQDMEGDEF